MSSILRIDYDFGFCFIHVMGAYASTEAETKNEELPTATLVYFSFNRSTLYQKFALSAESDGSVRHVLVNACDRPKEAVALGVTKCVSCIVCEVPGAKKVTLETGDDHEQLLQEFEMWKMDVAKK